MKKIALIFLALLWSGAMFAFGMKVGIDGTEKRLAKPILTQPNYTGQEILDAVNEYRQSKKLTTLKLDEELCNNVVNRYLVFKSPEADKEGHPGFDAWADAEIKKGYRYVGEVFSGEFTKEEVMSGWKGSPSHNEALVNPIYNRGCSYAGDYGVVVLLGAK